MSGLARLRAIWQSTADAINIHNQRVDLLLLTAPPLVLPSQPMPIEAIPIRSASLPALGFSKAIRHRKSAVVSLATCRSVAWKAISAAARTLSWRWARSTLRDGALEPSETMLTPGCLLTT